MASSSSVSMSFDSFIKPEPGQDSTISEPSTNFGYEEKPENHDETSLQKNNSRGDNIKGWVQVFGAFFLMFNSWGIANTFGAFQTYYETGLLASETASNISWIGSIQSFSLLLVGGLISGPIYDAGHLRGLVLVGSVCVVFGMMMTSLCTEYWQFILAQGIVTGTGQGCLLLPSLAVMPQYFEKRSAFATGVAAAGSSVGGVIYPIVFHSLQPRLGFGWATRIIGFIMIATLIIPNAVMRAKSFPATTRPLIDKEILKYIPYDLYALAAFFGLMGMYIPFYYISSFSASQGIVNKNLGFYTLSILNAASIFGRLVPNFFADITGPLNISGPFIFLCSIIAFCWTSVTTLPQLILFCIFYGFFSGTFVSITAPALATLSPNMALVGTHIGMAHGFGAFGLLIGNPVAGTLLKYGWIGPSLFCGTCNIIAALFIFASRLKKTGLVLIAKA